MSLYNWEIIHETKEIGRLQFLPGMSSKGGERRPIRTCWKQWKEENKTVFVFFYLDPPWTHSLNCFYVQCRDYWRIDRQVGREDNTTHSRLPQALDMLFLSLGWVFLVSLRVLVLFFLVQIGMPLGDPWCEGCDIKVGMHGKAVDFLAHYPRLPFAQNKPVVGFTGWSQSNRTHFHWG